jgi:hypothetical protein
MIYDCGLNTVDTRPSLKNDIAFGLQNEKLSKYFDESIQKTLEPYCPYDAFSPTTKYEIKSRRCLSTTYDTTIIPIKKVENVKDRLVFVFCFTDGLFYIVYNQELFDTFEKKNVTYYRQGGSNMPVLHYHIPVKDLIEIVL